MPFKPSLIHLVIAALIIVGYAVIAQIEYSPFSPPENGGDKAMEMMTSVMDAAAGNTEPAAQDDARLSTPPAATPPRPTRRGGRPGKI